MLLLAVAGVVGEAVVAVVVAVAVDEEEGVGDWLFSPKIPLEEGPGAQRREQLLLLFHKMLLLMKISRGNLNTFNPKSRNLWQFLSLISTMKVQSLQLQQFKNWKY